MPRTWVGRRVTSLIRSFLKRWSERPIDAVRLGSRMRLHPRGNASEKRLMTSPQFFDPAELGVLEFMLAPGFVFFDIGANVGAYTLFVATGSGAAAGSSLSSRIRSPSSGSSAISSSTGSTGCGSRRWRLPRAPAR